MNFHKKTRFSGEMARHLRKVMRHLEKVTHLLRKVTHHPQKVTHLPGKVTHLLRKVTHHLEKVMRHLEKVTRHLRQVTRHLRRVTCHFWQKRRQLAEVTGLQGKGRRPQRQENGIPGQFRFRLPLLSCLLGRILFLMTKHHILKLKTGETLCVAEMPHMESVSLGVWAGVGGRHDPSELGGLAQKAPALTILLVIVAFANISLPLTN